MPPQATCEGIPSVILSAHDPSEERDHEWVKNTNLTPPRHCKRCKVYLPEEVDLTSREITILLDSAWWHWLAHQAPNGLAGLKASLYESAKTGCVALTAASEETCFAILQKRAEFGNIALITERLRGLAVKPESELLQDWLGAVNQPVVDGIQSVVDEALKAISDGGNFKHEDCKRILQEITQQARPPARPSTRYGT